MAAVLSSKLYKSLPGIALALDEGLASTNNNFSVFYGERLPWFVDVTATGNTGHGSRFIENTAVGQIIDLANMALRFREGQKAALHGSIDDAKHMNCAHAVAAKKRRTANDNNGTQTTLGDVTSLNITTLQAGVKAGDTFVYNCVPPVAKVRNASFVSINISLLYCYASNFAHCDIASNLHTHEIIVLYS